MQRNSKDRSVSLRMKRATPSMEPPTGGVQRSSVIEVETGALHTPPIQATCAIVAGAFGGGLPAARGWGRHNRAAGAAACCVAALAPSATRSATHTRLCRMTRTLRQRSAVADEGGFREPDVVTPWDAHDIEGIRNDWQDGHWRRGAPRTHRDLHRPSVRGR